VKRIILIAGTIATSLLSFYSCSNKKTDFQKTKDGLEYKFIEQTQNTDSVSINTTVEIDVKYYSPTDSLLFDSDEIGQHFTISVNRPNPKQASNIDNALMMMHEGDSAIFMLHADYFYSVSRNMQLPAGLQEDDMLRFHIKLEKIFSQEEIDSIKQAKLELLKKQEYELLEDYIKYNHPSAKESYSGLYFEETKKGKGEPAQPGDSVVVHYEGQFLNGEYFASSYAKKQPLGFVLGHMNTIPAWEEAIARMNKGSKSTIIVPSHLAYGDKGSGKLIKPYTSLIFEIELLEIHRKK